jgi:hypothetical protein
MLKHILEYTGETNAEGDIAELELLCEARKGKGK